MRIDFRRFFTPAFTRGNGTLFGRHVDADLYKILGSVAGGKLGDVAARSGTEIVGRDRQRVGDITAVILTVSVDVTADAFGDTVPERDSLPVSVSETKVEECVEDVSIKPSSVSSLIAFVSVQ